MYRRLASHWMIYDPDFSRCLCISDTGNDKVLWEKSPFTKYIILTLSNLDFMEKKKCNLVTTGVDTPLHLRVGSLVINFLTKKAIWSQVIFVPIVGNQYYGHVRVHDQPPLDFANGFVVK